MKTDTMIWIRGFLAGHHLGNEEGYEQGIDDEFEQAQVREEEAFSSGYHRGKEDGLKEIKMRGTRT